MSFRQLFIALAATLSTSTAWAGIYTDELSKCLVDGTSTDDRTALVNWIFTAASAHPAIASLSKVTEADKDTADKAIGALFMKLLIESCKPQPQKALRFEEPATLQLSFSVLGQVAGAELFSNPAVAQGMAGLVKYLDAQKLEALKTEAPPEG